MTVISRIANEFCISESYILQLARSASHLYKTYQIPKRTVGQRTIHHPSKELKFLQRWLSDNILSTLPVHSCATAYSKGSSIYNNAHPHATNRYLLRIDFKDFFHSITDSDISTLLKHHLLTGNMSYGVDDIEIICRILTRHGTLTIGAPSSPRASNAVMYAYDCKFYDAAVKHNAVYTRYADDIYFSTNMPFTLDQILINLRGILQTYASPKLVINDKKTAFMSKKVRRSITGLTITSNGNISLGRRNKRRLRSMINESIHGKLDSRQQDYLKGYLAYAIGIEPCLLQKLNAKYGNDEITLIMSPSSASAEPVASSRCG